MSKRTRIDTATGAIELASEAYRGAIQPPPHVKLTSEQMPFWRAVISSKAPRFWTQFDLTMAAHLARTLYRIESINDQLLDEPTLVAGSTGAPKINPKHKLLDMLTSSAVALSRFLQVHSAATNGRSRDQAKANGAYQEAADLAEDEDDGLIAKPSIQ